MGQIRMRLAASSAPVDVKQAKKVKKKKMLPVYKPRQNILQVCLIA
jgi:hypothetical protein